MPFWFRVLHTQPNGQPLLELGWYYFSDVPRIGEAVMLKKAPDPPLRVRVVDVVRQAAPVRGPLMDPLIEDRNRTWTGDLVVQVDAPPPASFTPSGLTD